jgi:uroporphyrinogen-III decarboxylase
LKENIVMEKEWSALTREEKRDRRMQDYISGKGIHFRNAKAEKLYKERVNRMLKANRCEEPDRVPVSFPTGNYPAYYAGYNFKQVMYDYEACLEAWRKFMYDFYEDMDSFMGPGFVFSGRVMDLLDYKNYTWPGHGLGDDVNTFQFVEAPYMKADEYDYFLKDPSDYGFRVLTPRVMGAGESLRHFPPLNALMGIPMMLARPFTRADVREDFRRIIAAGEEMEKQQKILMEFNIEALEMGFPAEFGGLGVAPFDILGDFLRGTEGVAIDMFRQPEKLLEAIDMLTELTKKRLIDNVNIYRGHSVSFPLHKGDDTFMSRKQFEKFYWPSLKKVIDALIDEGISVSLFAEGAYNQRLEYIGDFPKGWVTWMFDQTDMANAKKMIGDRCCICGNVPGSTVIFGTPREVKEACRKLIETCAPGGGYILTGGCTATETKNPANFRAFMEAATEYGTY